MRIPRFYQPATLESGQDYAFSADTFHHAIQVLRLKTGDPVIVFNGEQGEFRAHITSASKKRAEFHTDSFDASERESALAVTLVLALIKPDKMDLAIQKAVELGVTAIQPVITERSVIRTAPARMKKKLSHWEKVIIGACEQSGRTRIPSLNRPLDLAGFLQQQSPSLRLALSPTSAQRLNSLTSTPACVELLIGPEGGFTDDELAMFTLYNVTQIAFGPRILRAETAVIAGLSVLQHHWGDI